MATSATDTLHWVARPRLFARVQMDGRSFFSMRLSFAPCCLAIRTCQISFFYHECAHAQDAERDEIEANCEAYLELDKLGVLTPDRIDALASTHKKMLRLPSRYGGSGEIFWQRTLDCVNQRLASQVN